MILLLLACTTWSQGQVERGELNCELLDTCGELDDLGYADLASCKEAAAAQPFDDADCPDYDAGAMAACLRAYQDAVDAAACDADLDAVCQTCG